MTSPYLNSFKLVYRQGTMVPLVTCAGNWLTAMMANSAARQMRDSLNIATSPFLPLAPPRCHLHDGIVLPRQVKRKRLRFSAELGQRSCRTRSTMTRVTVVQRRELSAGDIGQMQVLLAEHTDWSGTRLGEERCRRGRVPCPGMRQPQSMPIA